MEFRVMVEEDLPFFNEVRNSARDMLHCNKEFSLAETKLWFSGLDSINQHYLIITHENQDVGYFRMKEKMRTPTRTLVEIGMDLAAKYRGKGLAYQSYTELFELFGDAASYELEVLGTNVVGYNLYRKLGFVPYALGKDANHSGRLIPSIKMTRGSNE